MHRHLDTRMVAILWCRCTWRCIRLPTWPQRAHLKADDYVHMRYMRIRSLHAQRGKERKETDHNVDPGIVAALVLHKLNAMKCAA